MTYGKMLVTLNLLGQVAIVIVICPPIENYLGFQADKANQFPTEAGPGSRLIGYLTQKQINPTKLRTHSSRLVLIISIQLHIQYLWYQTKHFYGMAEDKNIS
jgi:hypothetical protein